jgi:protein TonB
MVNIMTERIVRKLDPARKLLLSAAALVAMAAPIVFGLVSATPKRAVSEAEFAAADGSQPVPVSQDEMSRLVRKKVPPQYPEAAKKAHLQGVVVLEATISRDGDVENLRIVSGHPMLVPPAIEAVKEWKYKPYRVNGEPVEVKTKVTVNFTLLD